MPASKRITEILQPQAKSPGHQGILHEWVSINGVIWPLKAEQSLPALQIMPKLVSAISEYWVYQYIVGTEHNKKKYVGRIKYVAKRHEHYIAKLQQCNVDGMSTLGKFRVWSSDGGNDEG